jgi:hypothetical protein
MQLVVTQAFAESALGAVAFEEGKFGDAQSALQVADELFSVCRHGEGHALNDRRRAAVERHLAAETRRSELNMALRFAVRSLDRYQKQRSPAGMAACEIEQGRLEMMDGGRRIDRSVKRLMARLEDTQQRNLLELDPWVPKVLVRFAEEVEDAGLVEHAKRLVLDGERRLVDWANRGAERTTGRLNSVRQRAGKLVAFEMGGEARSEEDAVCQVQVSA